MMLQGLFRVFSKHLLHAKHLLQLGRLQLLSKHIVGVCYQCLFFHFCLLLALYEHIWCTKYSCDMYILFDRLTLFTSKLSCNANQMANLQMANIMSYQYILYYLKFVSFNSLFYARKMLRCMQGQRCIVIFQIYYVKKMA